MKQIMLWTLEEQDGKGVIAKEIERLKNTETERKLEDLLVDNPSLLMKDLTLVARQASTEGGPLDLLGVDEDGNIIVIELKRGVVAREAVAQILDYTSYIASLDQNTLSSYISENSGHGGISKIEDFTEWYQSQYPSSGDNYSERPKMLIVGLGADERTKRMVDYLSDGGENISLITFQAFRHGDHTFLSRQVEVKLPESTRGTSRRYTKEENYEALQSLAKSLGNWDLLETMRKYLEDKMSSTYVWPSRTGYGFYLNEITDKGTPSNRSYISLYVDQNKKGKVVMAFYRRAMEAAGDKFDEFVKKDEDRFFTKYQNVNTLIKDEKDWNELKKDLDKVIPEMIKGWKKKMESIQEDEEE